jgi:4-hydroxy-tetrahydrodipicolinate synthase
MGRAQAHPAYGSFPAIMFTGVITAIVTPFRRGAVDEDALRNLVEDQIANGVDGLVPVGTTGESPTLSFEEHVRVIEVVVKAVAKRVPVIAGAGANATSEAIELSLAAKKVGADGLLQVTPYYNKPSQENLYRHFKSVVEACPLPTLLYNVPGRTGCDLLPETIARLAEVSNIVGVKEATGSALRATQVLSRVPSRFVVLSGDDATAFPLFALGAKGVISVISNVAPAEMAEMWDAAAAGRWDRARELHYKLLPLSEGLFIEANPVPVKSALAMMGRIADELRPPLYPLEGANREKVRGYLTQVGLL